MSQSDPNPTESLSLSPREQQLGELINEFFDRRQRGEALTEESFLAAHPTFATELREHFRSLDLIEKMGSSEQTLPGGATPAPTGSSASNTLPAGGPSLPSIPGYDIQKQIGRGGMGVVFKARQVFTKRTVALKVLLDGALASDSARARFEREIALAAQLRHPNIIPIYDSGAFDGRLYYAMEHVYGLSLADYFKAHPLPVKNRVRLFIKVCNAVSHAHQRGVIHRDLKPSNILVDGSGEPFVVDFGLAKAGSAADMNTSVTAQIIGTPAYMSPEQAAGDPGGIDTRSDVYSLGVVLYEVLTGRMPYETNVPIAKMLSNIAHAEATPPDRIDSQIDAELTAIVLKAIEKRKEDRYQSVDALETDLKNYLAGDPIQARPMTLFRLFGKFAYRHRASLLIGTAMVLVVSVTARLWMRSIEKKTEQLQQLQRQVTEKAAQNEQLQIERGEASRSGEDAEKALELALAVLLQDVPPERRPLIAEELRNIPAQNRGTLVMRLLTLLGRTIPPTAHATTGTAEALPQPPGLDFLDFSFSKEKTSEGADRVLRAMQRAMGQAWEQGLAVELPAASGRSASTAPAGANGATTQPQPDADRPLDDRAPDDGGAPPPD